jgi:hypothetical protein
MNAADRLREHMSDFHGNCPWVGEDHIALLDEALAEAAAPAPLDVEALDEFVDNVCLYLWHDGSGIGRQDRWAGDYDALKLDRVRDRLRELAGRFRDARLAPPARPADAMLREALERLEKTANEDADIAIDPRAVSYQTGRAHAFREAAALAATAASEQP